MFRAGSCALGTGKLHQQIELVTDENIENFRKKIILSEDQQAFDKEPDDNKIRLVALNKLLPKEINELKTGLGSDYIAIGHQLRADITKLEYFLGIDDN